MNHDRSLRDPLFGQHGEDSDDPDCAGSRCPACDCCMHCNGCPCDCTVNGCGCGDL